MTMVIEGNDNQVVGFAAPLMTQDLHIDNASFGQVFGIGLFGYMLGALTLSAVGDRIGRRRLVIAGAVVFCVFTIATAYASTLFSILPIRFCAGIGLGCAIPNAIALMAEYAPKSTRATRIALMFVAYTIGSALGGLLRPGCCRAMAGHRYFRSAAAAASPSPSRCISCCRDWCAFSR